MIFYASIYTYHSNDILLNLTETFELANKYCPNADNDRQFNTLHEAEVACADDEAYIGVDNYQCIENGYRSLCLVGHELYDHASSCFYKKIGNVISKFCLSNFDFYMSELYSK